MGGSSSSTPFLTPYTLSDLFFAGDKGVWRGTWHATQREAEWKSGLSVLIVMLLWVKRSRFSTSVRRR